VTAITIAEIIANSDALKAAYKYRRRNEEAKQRWRRQALEAMAFKLFGFDECERRADGSV